MPGPTESDKIISQTIEVDVHHSDNMDAEGTRSTETLAPDVDIFEFDSWACFLSQKSIKVLKKEDLISIDALRLLTEADTKQLGLSMGQRKQLDAAVLELRKTSPPDTSTGTLSDGNLVASNSPPAPAETEKQQQTGLPDKVTIRDIRRQKQDLISSGNELDSILNAPPNHLNSLLNPEPANASPVALTHQQILPVGQSSQTPLDSFDPRTVLTAKAVSQKAVHITTFLSEGAKKRLRQRQKDTVVFSRNPEGHGNLLVQPNDNHPYMGILISEWSAANYRVMNRLLQTGQLHRDHVEYYLAYSATVMDFAATFEWSSVLEFDYQYREHQAEHGFLWGYINPLLKMRTLQPRPGPGNSRPAHGRNMSNTNAMYSNHGSSSAQECKQWKANNGYCAFGDRCKYRHVPLQPSREHGQPIRRQAPAPAPHQPKNWETSPFIQG